MAKIAILKEYFTPYPKLAWFVLYPKIINTFLKIAHLIVHSSRNSKTALNL